MSHLTQTITLTSDHHYGRRLPPQALGHALTAIPALVRQSISMAFRGRSSVRGARPRWLAAAADMRFVDHQGEDASVLYFEVPKLGDAAPDLYAQQEFFWSTRPSPEDTGFDLLGDVLSDVASRNEDSDRFDAPLLCRLCSFRNILDECFQEVLVAARRYPVDSPARLTGETVAIAHELYSHTPLPQRVRIVGDLDMIRGSTQNFAIKLEDGQEVQGVLVDGDILSLTQMFRRSVVVRGRAVYRASGHVLRIEADRVELATERDRFFVTLPRPRRRRYDVRQIVREQSYKKGVEAIFGKWPGDETDEEIEEALKEIS
jgi:hypothetical protein